MNQRISDERLAELVIDVTDNLQRADTSLVVSSSPYFAEVKRRLSDLLSALTELQELRKQQAESLEAEIASCVPAMHICCNCRGRGEVGESPDGANWFSVACELCKGEGKTLRYVRRPTQDKRIGNGDDFAGDAWFDQAERKIVYGAVGVDRNAAPEAPKS